MHAESPRFVAAGRDDAALVWARADNERTSAPFWMVQKLDGCKERVHIDVKYRFHGVLVTSVVLYHLFASGFHEVF